MAEYGVWIEQADPGDGIATLYPEGATPPATPEREVVQFVWRGTAADADAALRAARAAWEERYGTRARGCHVYVVEIEPGDAGYRGEGS